MHVSTNLSTSRLNSEERVPPPAHVCVHPAAAPEAAGPGQGVADDTQRVGRENTGWGASFLHIRASPPTGSPGPRSSASLCHRR